MIITKRSLPRRTFLRGVGATLALPLLDAMVPALSAMARTVASPARRLGFIYVGNGVTPDKWAPLGEGSTFELSSILRPLAPFRNRLTVLSGLAHRQAEPFGDGDGDHMRAQTVWLTGVHPKKAEAANIRAATTADQIAAQQLGKHTRLPSLETALDVTDKVGNCNLGYSCTYANTLSWRTPTTPLPMERNPRLVFQQLFGEGGSAEDRLAQARDDQSILDSVTQEVTRLQNTLGSGDRRTVSQYLDAIRDIEHRIQKIEQDNGSSPLSLPERPIGVPEDFEEHAKLMFDLQVLAYQADITRVNSMLVLREISARTYPGLGVLEGHHNVSHHQNNPEKLAQLAKIDTLHIQLLAYYLEKLDATPDGDGSLLDHAMILYGGGINDGNKHDHVNLPTLLVGGGAGQHKGGRHVRYPETPMANLLLTLLDKVGVPTEKLGDSTGRLEDI